MSETARALGEHLYVRNIRGITLLSASTVDSIIGSILSFVELAALQVLPTPYSELYFHFT